MIHPLKPTRTLLTAVGCMVAAGGAFALATCPPDQAEVTVEATIDLLDATTTIDTISNVGLTFVPTISDDRRSLRYAWHNPTDSDDGVVATITLAVDENNNVVKVLVNNVKVDPELVVQVEGNVELVGRDGDLLAQVELIADTLSWVQLVTPEISRPAVRVGITMEEVSQAVASQVRVMADEVVMVAEVAEGGPAQKAGLQQYDIITLVDGSGGATQAKVREVVRTKNPGDTLTFHVMRGGEMQEVVVQVEADDDHGQYLVTGYLEDRAVNTAIDATRTYQTDLDLYRPTLVGHWNTVKPVLTEDRRAVEYTVETPQLLLEPVDTSYDHWVEKRNAEIEHRWLQSAERGVILEVAPRVVEGQVVLETSVLLPSVSLDWVEDVDPVCQLRQQVAQLKAQIIKLEELLGDMGGD